jgi:hypothetical protein
MLNHHHLFFLFFFLFIIIRHLTSFVESFGLLNDVFPFHSVLNTGCPIFNIQLMDVLYYIVFPSLGLPLDLTVRGVQLNIFLTILESGTLCTWPNQLSLRALIWLIIFWCFINLSSSLLVLILHNWFSLVGLNTSLRIFLSNTNSFWIEDSFNTQVSEA